MSNDCLHVTGTPTPSSSLAELVIMHLSGDADLATSDDADRIASFLRRHLPERTLADLVERLQPMGVVQ